MEAILVASISLLISVFAILFVDWRIRLKEESKNSKDKQCSGTVSAQDISLHIVTAQHGKQPTVCEADPLNEESERVTFYKN